MDRRGRRLLAPPMTERPILLVGSPRGGTTLLRDLLRSHPRLTFPPESNVLPELHRLHGDPATVRRGRLLAADLLRSFSIRAWGLELTIEELAEERTFAAMVERLYGAWAAREGKARWGDKTPLHALELPAALAIFPRAQVVHLVRDGRDVTASLLRQPWGPACAAGAARLWRRCVDAAQRDGAALGKDGYHEVRFEDLVAEPEPVLGKLCAFLGEEYDPGLLAPSRIPAPAGLRQPWPARQEQAIDGGTVGRWRGELSPVQLAAVEAEAGPALRRLGYGGDSPEPGLRERGCRARGAARTVRWRATTWDRLPRAETALRLARARVLHRLGLIG